MFNIRNNINIISLGKPANEKSNVKRYLVYWSVYDNSKNIPNIYTMHLDCSETNLDITENAIIREKLEKIIYAQSSSSLKLITIANAIDAEFAILHPKGMRRIYIGPMYSNAFTKHNNHIQKVLKDAPEGKDWVFSWTVETLLSQRQEYQKKGIWGGQFKEIYLIDRHDKTSWDSGASMTDQYMILPYEAYQALCEDDQNPLNHIYKYVVGKDNVILTNL